MHLYNLNSYQDIEHYHNCRKFICKEFLLPNQQFTCFFSHITVLPWYYIACALLYDISFSLSLSLHIYTQSKNSVNFPFYLKKYGAFWIVINNWSQSSSFPIINTSWMPGVSIVIAKCNIKYHASVTTSNIKMSNISILNFNVMLVKSSHYYWRMRTLCHKYFYL